MVPIANFPCWFAKEHDKSESSGCVCPVGFLSLKKCMARCFLVQSTPGAACYLVGNRSNILIEVANISKADVKDEKIFHQLHVASRAANLLTLTFGAARRFSELHAMYRLVCMRSPMLNEFWRPRCCAQGRSFQSVPAASQYAFEKVLKVFHPYFTGGIVICVFQGR